MGFASVYLDERALFPVLINEIPAEDTGIIVVIPSYDEPEISDLLDSLAICDKPDCGVEVIIVINAPQGAGRESILNNKNCIANTKIWRKEHPECFYRLFLVDVTDNEPEGWGVGLARKTGMDEAVRRFNYINNTGGIILNLDADCRVRSNYLRAVYEGMHEKKQHTACSIYFEHPLSGNEFSKDVYRSITLYELHLRYFYQGLKFCGFPYVHHTVGSTIAVKALAYVKAGGMNRRVAGEDFYFIQKLLPTGGYFNLNTTVVFPSPRLSSRVPFGTGMTVSRISGSENKPLLTYNFESFRELRKLFLKIESIYHAAFSESSYAWDALPESIRHFIGSEEWTSRVGEIIRNTSGIEPFRKRFFNWFNMFRIVKYLNAVNVSFFSKKPVEVCASELLQASGHKLKSEDAADLLGYFRLLELSS